MKIIPKVETMNCHENPSTHTSALWLNGEPVLPILNGSSIYLPQAVPEASKTGRTWLKGLCDPTPDQIRESRMFLIVKSNLEVENLKGFLTVFPTDSDNWVILGIAASTEGITLFDPDNGEVYLYDTFLDRVYHDADIGAYDRYLTRHNLMPEDYPFPVWDSVEKTYHFPKESFIPVVDLLKPKN